METTKLGNLTDIFEKNDSQGTQVGERLKKLVNKSQRHIKPPFPIQIQVETTNACNHSCSFCAYTKMERPKKHMDKKLFRKLVKEAFENGAREIGLFSGAEPLTCKWLDEYIEYCTEVGYTYIYISTNGALGTPTIFKKLIEAGLSSIKFSVNGGTREVYKNVHGRDNFDKVIENICFINNFRKETKANIFLGVSFVATEYSKPSYKNLVDLLDGVADEILFYEASNQSGQMMDLPLPPYSDCNLPFNKLHISREGYIKVCCNDYENLLAVEDLNHMSMIEAWHSNKFQEIRRKHILNELDGTLCGKCIRGCHGKAEPLNSLLYFSGNKNV